MYLNDREAAQICFWQLTSKCDTYMTIINRLHVFTVSNNDFCPIAPSLNYAWHCHLLCAALSSSVGVVNVRLLTLSYMFMYWSWSEVFWSSDVRLSMCLYICKHNSFYFFSRTTGWNHSKFDKRISWVVRIEVLWR